MALYVLGIRHTISPRIAQVAPVIQLVTSKPSDVAVSSNLGVVTRTEIFPHKN